MNLYPENLQDRNFMFVSPSSEVEDIEDEGLSTRLFYIVGFSALLGCFGLVVAWCLISRAVERKKVKKKVDEIFKKLHDKASVTIVTSVDGGEDWFVQFDKAETAATVVNETVEKENRCDGSHSEENDSKSSDDIVSNFSDVLAEELSNEQIVSVNLSEFTVDSLGTSSDGISQLESLPLSEQERLSAHTLNSNGSWILRDSSWDVESGELLYPL